MTSEKDPHDRGSFTHPEDGETYKHPSSLQSAHHVGPDGVLVHSPAQKAALAHAKTIDERQAKEKAPETERPLALNDIERDV